MTKVLVVDDEPDYPQLLGIILTKEGFDVRTATGSDEAYQIAAQFCPDVLVVDWMLEGSEDGLKVAATLGTRHPGLQSVLITGYPSLTLENHVERIPSVRFLTKPFTPAHLLELVRDAAGAN